MMRKKVLTLLLSAVLTSALLLTGVAVAAATAPTGETLVSFLCDGNEAALNKGESSALGESGILVYTNGGANGAVKTTELYAAGAHGVYDFDLADTVTEAYFNFVGDSFTVAYKADGDTNYTDFTLTHGQQFTVYTLTLSSQNALKNANKKFKLRFTNSTARQLNLHKVSVMAKQHKLISEVKLTDSNAVSAGLPYILSADGSFTYWEGGAEKGFLHGTGKAQQILYRFPIDSAAMPKITLIAPILDGGVNAAWQYSTDAATYQTYTPGREIETAGIEAVYIKITTEEGNRILVKGLGFEKVIEAGKDLTEVYERADGSESETPFLKATDKQQIYSAELGGSGLAGVPQNVRLVQPQGYLVYEFDLENGIDEAYFNLIGTGFKVEYSVDKDNGYAAYLPIESETAAGANYLVRSYKLTSANALSASTNAFRIKLTNPNAAAGDACLYSFGIFTHKQAIAGIAYDANNITLGLSHVVGASGGSVVYFDDGDITKGYAYLQAGGEIEYRFTIDSVNAPKPVLSLDMSGGAAEWRYSTDGATYTAGGGDNSVSLKGASAIYVKVKNNGPGDLLFKGLSIRNDETIATGINANPGIPENENESYILVGSDTEKNHMFGVETDYQAAFESTHEGMTKDGHEGGWGNSMPDNARKLLAGQYIAYDFDLSDGITSAKLKLHAGTGIKVKISSDNGATVQTLTTTQMPGGRGMYIFDLTESDALKNADNTFRLVIEATGESYVFALLVHGDSEKTASEGVSLKPWSQDGLRYLVKTNKVHAYYGHGLYQNYFFKEADSYAIFKVKFDSSVTDPVFFINQCGDVKAELSSDGVTYTEVFSSLLGGTGEVPYNTYDAKSYLGENKTIYIKLGNSGTGGFVADVGFASAAAAASKGTLDMETFGKNLVSVSTDANGIGTLKTYNHNNGSKAFILSGSAVFKLNLNEQAIGVKLSVRGYDGTGEIHVSKDGVKYELIGSVKNGVTNLLNYSSLTDNDAKTIYVKLTGANFVTDRIEFTTEGILPQGDSTRPYDDPSVFDYDRNLPLIGSYGKPTVTPDNVPGAEVTFNRALVIGLSVGGGSLAVLGIGFILVWQFVIKRRRVK